MIMIKITHQCRATMVMATVILLTFYKPSFAQTTDVMKAHFINVGQADAALVEFPCGAILIDAGAENAATQQNLITYIKNFFARRPDLHNTLDLVIISHDHIDHNLALKAVSENFHIKNYIDNGHTKGSGQINQGFMQAHTTTLGANYENFSYEQVTAKGNKHGLSDSVIEPIHCTVISPQITILSGRVESRPVSWTQKDFSNENNHSLVVRIQYGKASFLFTGDLETAGDSQLINLYKPTGLLDADVWKVSHHGAVNGTNQAWVDAITPKYAVISCGQWFDGDHSTSKFNTYHYGHPRVSTLNFLSASIPGNRMPLDTPIVAFNGIRVNHTKMSVTKNIYCTAWDGNITITATKEADYRVTTKGQ